MHGEVCAPHLEGAVMRGVCPLQGMRTLKDIRVKLGITSEPSYEELVEDGATSNASFAILRPYLLCALAVTCVLGLCLGFRDRTLNLLT